MAAEQKSQPDFEETNMSGANKHPYHLVEASPWPAVGSAAAFTAAVGGVMYMHDVAYGVAVLGLDLCWFLQPCSCGGAILFARRISKGIRPIVQIGMRYGMMLFIASEVMFFVAFFWAFFDRAFYPNEGFGRQRASQPLTRLTCL